MIVEAENHTHIDSVLVTSDTEKRIAGFRVRLATEEAKSASLRIAIVGAKPVTSSVAAETNKDTETAIEVPLPDAPVWSPDHPTVLTAKIQLPQNGNEIDSLTQRFGFRKISTPGNVLLLNGKPLYLRAYGDDDVEVLNGFPPASPDVCLRRIQLAKSFGFNAVRFHSMTPPACYFNAADQVGILIMAELPAAYTQFFFAHRDFLRGELVRTLTAYRNHPSLLSLAFGNEFNLRGLTTQLDRDEQLIADNKLESIYPEYLKNSIRLQQLGRKFQIERTRADHSVSGYDYWLLVDYPGGTGEGDSREEGWFDYLWDPKVTPGEGGELNSGVLPLIDAGVDERTLWSSESKHIGLSISDYGVTSDSFAPKAQLSDDFLHQLLAKQ